MKMRVLLLAEVEEMTSSLSSVEVVLHKSI